MEINPVRNSSSRTDPSEVQQNDEYNRQSNIDSDYDQYLLAMRRIQRSSGHSSLPERETPRKRHRTRLEEEMNQGRSSSIVGSLEAVNRIAIIASMVPDEIIHKHDDYSVRTYDSALMFLDVSGFSTLCENYTLARGGPSRLSQILNNYIGAMVQEVLTHNGDVLKFSGDALISIWKKTPRQSMQDVVHTAIDCGLILQNNYGSLMTDVGILLQVKIAISAGITHFAIIGGTSESTAGSSYVLTGQPVWDAKMAEYLSTAGDVITSASAWEYANEAEYCTQPYGDGKHTKVLGVGATWHRVQQLHESLKEQSLNQSTDANLTMSDEVNRLRQYSLRPSMVAAIRSSWWLGLRRFMLAPVLRAVDNDEPLDFLTEVRRVVVVFLNIVTKSVTDPVLINIVDTVFSCVTRVTSESGGLVNKVSMFDKDMMFLTIFGLRGLKYEDEAQKALLCAYQLKTTIEDENIISLSIGVTSGISYCGLIGHILRREYTVIGPTVNKAARLMTNYPNKVTCDKETFLRSKLHKDFFKLMEPKILKGISNPGPIYEFEKMGWPERVSYSHYPILGRSEELERYEATLNNALVQQDYAFTRYRDHQYAIAFIGPRMIGKTKMLEACLNITPKTLHIEKMFLSRETKTPYGVFRQIAAKTFEGSKLGTFQDNIESRIRFSVDVTSLTPTQIHGINTIFDCRFPLPQTFQCDPHVLDNFSVKQIFQKICEHHYKTLWILAIDEAQHIDDESWRILLLLLDAKKVFVVLTLTKEEELTQIGTKCLDNGMIVKMTLEGLDRQHYVALTCQLLDVQAIPAALVKIIDSASGGKPGWIQNFVISLVQRGALTVVTLPRSEAKASGALMPPVRLLQLTQSSQIISRTLSETDASTSKDTGLVQMAVLSVDYIYSDMAVDMDMDVIILQTYDSLSPFEKMLLKCASVLGDVFSRVMLLYSLQNSSTKTVAQAVAKLFEIRVLECEGGDFSQDTTTTVMIRPAPAVRRPRPFCNCVGTGPAPNYSDLPKYAFCGYMKFRHPLFRTTTYDLLTESQKQEMHARVLTFLERYTRKCKYCGFGSFAKLMGIESYSGRIEESEKLKKTREQIFAFSAETKVLGDSSPVDVLDSKLRLHSADKSTLSSFNFMEPDGVIPSILEQNKRVLQPRETKHRHESVRTFSSLVLKNCECLAILQSVYCQFIKHCRGAMQYDKLYEAYIEYAEIHIMNLNIPEAVRLLLEVENFVSTHQFYQLDVRKDWVMDYQLARIYSLRGMCMLESREIEEAKKLLLLAMKLFGDPFPTSKLMVSMRSVRASVNLTMLSVFPKYYQKTHTGLIGHFFDDIAATLCRIHKLFTTLREFDNAFLAAKMALSYAVKRGSNFPLLCIAYGNLISEYRQKSHYSKCIKFEKKAMAICFQKRGMLDVPQVQAICYLYTNIFLLYVDLLKPEESMEYGNSVLHMMTNLMDLNTRQVLVIWMLKILLSALKIHEMVSLMTEFLYMKDYCDLSSEAWYYYSTTVVLLDTGYSVESYRNCESFYIKNGDAILRSKTPEAGRNFIAAMWLVTIRIGAWEKYNLWKDAINELIGMSIPKHDMINNASWLTRLVEGLIIVLVREIDDRNAEKILVMLNTVKEFLNVLDKASNARPSMHRPRYFILLAYYHYIRGKKERAMNYLRKARDYSKAQQMKTLIIWVDHTYRHWNGTLNPIYVDYWTQHARDDNLLNYNNFDSETERIIPYTLPVPEEFLIF